MVDIETAWDEPWRSLSEAHVRHLAVALSRSSSMPAADQSSEAMVTLRFWTSGYSVISAAEIDNPGDLPKPLAIDVSAGAVGFSVRLTSVTRKLVVLAIAMARSLGLRDGITKIGVLRTAGGKEVPLELNCGFSPSEETEYWILAAGIAAELATRTAIAAEEMVRLASDLGRCGTAAGRALAGPMASLREADVSSRSAQRAREDATRIASELAATLWNIAEQKRAPAASTAVGGTAYDLGSDEDLGASEVFVETPPKREPRRAEERSDESTIVPDFLPESLRAEWEILTRHYNAQIERRDRIDIVRIQVARHEVEAWLTGFPKLAPTLRVSPALKHTVIGHEGVISGLSSLTRWNRTLGLAHVLRELEREWGLKHPVLITGPSALARLRGWLKTNTKR